MMTSTVRDHRAFEQFQNALRREYRAAGMSEECIREMYEYDLAAFKRDQIYHIHNASLDFTEDATEDLEPEDSSATVLRYLEEIRCSDQYLMDSFSDIVESLDSRLYKAVRMLTEKQRTILEMMVVRGMTKVEVARELNISPSTITKQMEWIGKKFKKCI